MTAEALTPDAKPKGWSRQAHVQGMRALAVAAVVVFHTGFGLPGGYLGVDLFFVISGWAISGGLMALLAEGRGIRAGDYLARRARRILPLLTFVILVTLVVEVLTTNPFVGEPVVARTAIAGAWSVANLYLYRNTGYFDVEADARNPLLHLWSLSAEEQLYLVLPLLLVGGWWVGRRRGVVAVALVGAVASLAMWAALWAGWGQQLVQAPQRLAFYAPVTRLWEVAAGVVVAVLWPPRERPDDPDSRRGGARDRWQKAAVWAALLAMGAVFVASDSETNNIGSAIVVVASAMLLLALVPSVKVAGWLSARPLVWLGNRSFGWYLWHWPAIVVADRLAPLSPLSPVVGAAVALALAATGYRLESRIRADDRVVGWRAVGLVTLSVMSVTVAGLVVQTGRDHGWGLEEPLAWYDTPLGSRSGCLIVNRDMVNSWDPDWCVTPPGGQPAGESGESTPLPSELSGSVMVLGDSGVISATPAAAAVAAERGTSMVEWGRTGCPFVAAAPVGQPRCYEWHTAAWALVEDIQPAVVVIANRSLDFTVAEGSRLDASGPRLEAWANSLSKTLDRLAELAIPAVVVGPVPDYGGRFPRERMWPLRPEPEVPELARADVEESRQAVVSAELAVVARHSGAAYVDPLPLLCPKNWCSPVLDGRWTYTDAHHLNRVGGRRLVSAFRDAIDAVHGR